MGKSVKIFFVNFHSLNNRAADSACRILKDEGFTVFLIDWWKAAGIHAKDILTDTKYGTGHGGEMITSVLLACAPQTVCLQKAVSAEPKNEFKFYMQHLYNSGSPFFAYGNFSDYCEQSTWGTISHASKEKGFVIIEKTMQSIATFINEANTIP